VSGERIPIREVQPPWGPSPNVAVYLYVKASDIEAIVRRVVAEVDRSGGDFFRCKMCGGRKERETGHCGCGQTRWYAEFSGDRPRDIPESGTQIIDVCATCGEVARLKRIEVAARNLEKALAHWRPWRNGDYIEALAAFRKALEAK